MSAPAFYVCFGVRIEVDSQDAALVDLLERRKHPWQILARQHKLTCLWGTTQEESQFFVLLGTFVGRFGLENDSHGELSFDAANALMDNTKKQMTDAGITDVPAWHFQFEPDR